MYFLRSILPQRFAQSFLELKNTRSLTGISMLISLSVVLSFFSVNITENMKIGIGFVITATLGMIYGPVAGGLAAAVGDVIQYLLKPTGPYFFGFSLTALLGAVVYGIFFYKSSCTIPKAIAAKTIVSLFLNCFLNTLWISLLYGTPFSVLFVGRATKNLLTLPLEIILLYMTLQTVTKLLARSRINLN